MKILSGEHPPVQISTIRKRPRTIGVSSNVIDASWQALLDAYEYHLLQVEEAGRADHKATR